MYNFFKKLYFKTYYAEQLIGRTVRFVEVEDKEYGAIFQYAFDINSGEIFLIAYKMPLIYS